MKKRAGPSLGLISLSRAPGLKRRREGSFARVLFLLLLRLLLSRGVFSRWPAPPVLLSLFLSFFFPAKPQRGYADSHRGREVFRGRIQAAVASWQESAL